MKQIHPNLYVGPKEDYGSVSQDESWAMIRAGAEFYPDVDFEKSDPPPLRENRELLLSLIDAVVEVDIPRFNYEAALNFIDEHLHAGRSVLIHCNRGMSRSASIGMAYLASRTDRFSGMAFDSALAEYETIYPAVRLGKAIRFFLLTHWSELNQGKALCS